MFHLKKVDMVMAAADVNLQLILFFTFSGSVLRLYFSETQKPQIFPDQNKCIVHL